MGYGGTTFALSFGPVEFDLYSLYELYLNYITLCDAEFSLSGVL